MTEVRLSINDTFLQDMRNKMGQVDAGDITLEALSVFEWTIKQVAEGRMILSTDKDGKNPIRLSAPVFSRVKKSA